MKLKNCICLFLFLTAFQYNAQTTSKSNSDPKFKVNVSADRSVQVEFPIDKNVYNVLVLLIDSSGHTVFLDSQYNIKGIYKRSIDLKKYAAGDYYLKISNDDVVINKKLSIE